MPSEADNVLNILRDTQSELATLGTGEPANWGKMNYDQRIQYIDSIKSALLNTSQITNKLQHANDQKQKTLTELNSLGVETKEPINAPQVTAKKIFNLSKYSQLVETDKNTPSTAQIRTFLDSFVSSGRANGLDEKHAKAEAVDQAYQMITNEYTNPNQSTSDPFIGNIQGNSQQTVRDAVNTYYSSSDEAEKDQAAAVLARTIFPQGLNNPKQETLAQFVQETNILIKKLAESHVSSAKIFNLKKEAHIKNITNFDPQKAIKDEFWGIPMSENDLLERNKGFGIHLNNMYSLNWEKVWRETVMDKYDPLYIERRFEIDRSVPPTNHYQLKPGEKRRIIPPEYGITEGRLESNRSKMNRERRYEPSSPGKPFNWKKAQYIEAKAPSPADMGYSNPLKPALIKKQEWLCHVCQNPLKVNEVNVPLDRCASCGALQNGKAIPGKFKTGPDPAKKSQTPVGNIQGPIIATNNTDVEKLASAYSGIFFDSNDLKFVVIAGKNKKKFDTYYEAEEFKTLAQRPSTTPKNGKPRIQLTPEQKERQDQIAQHADILAIDG